MRRCRGPITLRSMPCRLSLPRREERSPAMRAWRLPCIASWCGQESGPWSWGRPSRRLRVFARRPDYGVEIHPTPAQAAQAVEMAERILAAVRATSSPTFPRNRPAAPGFVFDLDAPAQRNRPFPFIEATNSFKCRVGPPRRDSMMPRSRWSSASSPEPSSSVRNSCRCLGPSPRTIVIRPSTTLVTRCSPRAIRASL